jgi:hypothetical protein
VKHFDETSWADFARGLVADTAKMRMQKHLDGGCRQCAATLGIWQGVMAMAETERAQTPPADIVRVVKSQFAALASPASSGFRLLFDSNLAPVTAGIRGSVAARQFLYETDDYYIDLRLEPRRESERACVVGQVLHRTGKDRAAQGIAVRVREGKSSITETSTNQYGEFQLEFEASDGLFISVSRDKTSEVVLPLYGVQVKSPERKDLD